MESLRDNKDGTCNCRPLLGGCFFTDGFGGPCDCKCHRPAHTTEEAKIFASENKRVEDILETERGRFDDIGEPQGDWKAELSELIRKTRALPSSDHIGVISCVDRLLSKRDEVLRERIEELRLTYNENGPAADKDRIRRHNLFVDVIIGILTPKSKGGVE